MKITKRQLRRIIKEERAKLREVESWNDATDLEHEDPADKALRQAMKIFGSDVLVDEEDGEVLVDVGDDEAVEAAYDTWISIWPDGQMEEDGLIYTGIYL